MPYSLQIPLLSFEDILETAPADRLTKTFAFLSEHLDPLARKLEQKVGRGPDGYRPRAMLQALISMFLLQIPTRARLAERLEFDLNLAWHCGFDIYRRRPSEATLCRFFDRLSQTPGIMEAFTSVVKRGMQMDYIGGEAAATDSSHVWAYERQKKRRRKPPEFAQTRDEKVKLPDKSKRREPFGEKRPRPRIVEDLATNPAFGRKKNSRGESFFWFGYKMHAVVDKSTMPIGFCITSANVNDCIVYLPLLRHVHSALPELPYKYQLADEAYDTVETYTQIREEFGAQAIIPLNLHNAKAPPDGMTFEGVPVCTADLPMIPWGADGTKLKFRCPEAAGKGRCPLDMHCSKSPYGLTIKRDIHNDPRRLSIPLRGSRRWEQLFNQRTAVERFFSQGRCYFQMDNLRIRGIKKVRTHMALMCLALVASTLAMAESKAVHIAKKAA